MCPQRLTKLPVPLHLHLATSFEPSRPAGSLKPASFRNPSIQHIFLESSLITVMIPSPAPIWLDNSRTAQRNFSI